MSRDLTLARGDPRGTGTESGKTVTLKKKHLHEVILELRPPSRVSLSSSDLKFHQP
jgi:hypothetical protein